MIDVLIIGAGAAGLEAAIRLREAGLSVRIVEARRRVGGRIWDIGHRHRSSLGAEFIHGEAPLTKARLDRYGQTWTEIHPSFHLFENERLRPLPDYWDLLAETFRRLPSRGPDKIFDAFLRTSGVPRISAKLATAFVGGFDAAETNRISAKALGEAADQVLDPKSRVMARPTEGYRPLMEAMAREAEDALRLDTIVTSVAWKPGKVVVRAARGAGEKIFRARRALITLPIGVLKAPAGTPGAVRFEPEIPGLRENLAHLEMGPVVRLGLEFDPYAYSMLTERFKEGFPFVASPDLDFLTWWSASGATWPEITAWAGGAHAIRLGALPRAERTEIALENLARILGVRASTLAHALRQVHDHHWQDDPYAQGAYSYPAVSAGDAAKRIARPVENTVYFAGEALDPNSATTVEGALASGKKTAERILEDLRGTDSRRPAAPSINNYSGGYSDAGISGRDGRGP